MGVVDQIKIMSTFTEDQAIREMKEFEVDGEDEILTYLDFKRVNAYASVLRKRGYIVKLRKIEDEFELSAKKR